LETQNANYKKDIYALQDSDEYLLDKITTLNAQKANNYQKNINALKQSNKSFKQNRNFENSKRQ